MRRVKPSGCHTHTQKEERCSSNVELVADGGHLHLARNDGSAPVRIYATFFARKGTTEFLTPRPDPGVCPS